MFTNFDKAIAGGLVAAVVSVLARFGFHPQVATVSAIGVVVTAIVGFAAGHLAVYFTKNKNSVIAEVVKVAEAVVPPAEVVTPTAPTPPVDPTGVLPPHP